MFKNIVQIILVVVILNSCDQRSNGEGLTSNKALTDLKPAGDLKFAKRFSISENASVKMICLFGNKDPKDTSAIYYLLKDSSLKLSGSKKTFILNRKCDRIASLSSVYSTMLTELGETEKIVAVENLDYYNNPFLLEKNRRSALAELSKGPEIDLEKTILLHPNVVFTFGMSGSVPDAKLTDAGIPVVIAVDHLEEHPLARAEWIKFFAAFTDKMDLADSLFKTTEKNYDQLRSMTQAVHFRPTVLTEIKTGELWYVPGGKSFMSTFIKDAGGKYLWEDVPQSGSLALGLEEVFVKAKEADFWLNQALVNSKKEMKEQEPRYADFKAFQTGQLYNNTLHCNQKGYSNYWETGILHPDQILSDLIQLLHPELKVQDNRIFYFYQKLKD
ncbi:MAG TPA: ABC transporter substrate-binding protein [Bacteroidia bacterium]|nr:ABC transporter substrate-binding protein [Bacteroidia bacterium]